MTNDTSMAVAPVVRACLGSSILERGSEACAAFAPFRRALAASSAAC